MHAIYWNSRLIIKDIKLMSFIIYYTCISSLFLFFTLSLLLQYDFYLLLWHNKSYTYHETPHHTIYIPYRYSQHALV